MNHYFSIFLIIMFSGTIKTEILYGSNQQLNSEQNNQSLENPVNPERNLYLKEARKSYYDEPERRENRRESRRRENRRLNNDRYYERPRYETRRRIRTRSRRRSRSRKNYERGNSRKLVNRNNLEIFNNSRNLSEIKTKYPKLTEAFDFYLSDKTFELAKIDQCAENFCLTKYCINDKNILADNPNSGETQDPALTFSHKEDESIVKKLEGLEIGIYNDYKDGLKRKHSAGEKEKIRVKCMEICQKQIKVYAEEKKTELDEDPSNKDNFIIFDKVYTSHSCDVLRVKDKKSKYEMAEFCDKIGFKEGVEPCWAKYGNVALQACQLIYSLERHVPTGFIRENDRRDILNDNYKHALDYFAKMGPFTCSNCYTKFPDNYIQIFCNFKFKKDDCSFLYSTEKVNCLKKTDDLTKICSRYAFGACYNTCSIGKDTLTFYVQKTYKSYVPRNFATGNVNGCAGECTVYNKKTKICDTRDNLCLTYYNKQCKADCEKNVNDKIALQGKKLTIFKLKLSTVIGRTRNKQAERNKFDDQNIHKTKRMSFRYMRESIYDAIILMENKIYTEQQKLVDKSGSKSGNFEEELQNKILKFYMNEKEFVGGDNELNVFDLQL